MVLDSELSRRDFLEFLIHRIIVGGLVGTLPSAALASPAADSATTIFRWGRYSPTKMDSLLARNQELGATVERLEYLSGALLGIPFQAGTLKGSVSASEQLVVDLEGVDCFTYLDYVVAGSESKNSFEFVQNIQRIRYRGGVVSFRSRNHFFTQWVDNNAQIDEVTTEVCPGVVREQMVLNKRPNGGYWVEGIPFFPREIAYLSLENFVREQCLQKVLSGDLVGFVPRARKYDGLGALHVGLVVRKAEAYTLRHASFRGSSKEERLEAYLARRQNKFKGVMVARYHS